MSVISVGDFDGVHLGHRALLSRTVDLARQLGTKAIVLTFDRNTKRTLNPDFLGELTQFSEKKTLLLSAGVDEVAVVSFDEIFVNTSGEDFLDYLREVYDCTDLVGGTDFRFGRGGTLSLTDGATVKGIRQHTLELKKDLVKISSSAIRTALRDGLIEQANTWLGYAFSVSGTVEEGLHLGRTIGFPTVNLTLPSEKILPKDGVYITRTYVDGRPYASMTNVGVRPTVQGEKRRNVETHLLDGGGELYGRQITVTFHSRLRDEIRFSGMGELMQQLRSDRDLALERHKILSRY